MANKPKQLNQTIFKGLRDDVLSASIDSLGRVWAHQVKADELKEGSERMEDPRETHIHLITCSMVASGFDASNWRNSAIDREMPKISKS